MTKADKEVMDKEKEQRAQMAEKIKGTPSKATATTNGTTAAPVETT
jgi:hypothetical protein